MTTDNTNPGGKIALRKHFLQLVERPHVLECYAGEDRKMYHAVYTGLNVTALDLRGGNGVKKIDNRQYIRKHADDYNYFDLDAYGSPYEQLITLFAKRQSKDPFVVVVTDGQKLNTKWDATPKLLQGVAGIPRGFRLYGAYWFYDQNIWYILRAASERYGIEITGAKIVNGDVGNMLYYGFIARKKELV